MSFNIFKALQYLSIAEEVGMLVESANAKTAYDYLNLGSQIAVIIDPKLSNDADYQASQKLLGAVQAAQNGQTGVVATVPMSVNSQKISLIVTVGPA